MDETPAQHPARRRVLVWAVGLVGIVMVAAALVLPSVLRHDPTQGPLDVASGGLYASPPKGRPDRWTVNFGMPTCVTGDSPATLVKATWLERSGDGTIRTRASTLAYDEESGTTGFVGKLGDPAKAVAQWGGTLGSVKGHRVTTRCSSDPRRGTDELVTSVTVGPGGMAISGLRVHYEVDGKDYVFTDRETDYAACGWDGSRGEHCSEE